MENRMGMEELIPIVENLYLDYLAFRHIARTAEQERWAIHLNDYRRANSTRIGRQFGAITDALQTAPPVYSAQFDAAVQQLADLLVEGMVSR